MNIVDSSHSFVQRLISSTAVYHVSDELHQQITDAWRLLRQEDSEERLLDGLIKLLPANNIRRYMAANVAVDERGEQVYAPRNISLKHGVLNNSVTVSPNFQRFRGLQSHHLVPFLQLIFCK